MTMTMTIGHVAIVVHTMTALRLWEGVNIVTAAHAKDGQDEDGHDEDTTNRLWHWYFTYTKSWSYLFVC